MLEVVGIVRVSRLLFVETWALRFVCGKWQVDRTRSLQSIAIMLVACSGVANGRGMGGNVRVDGV